jgi:hypothetical protein
MNPGAIVAAPHPGAQTNARSGLRAQAAFAQFLRTSGFNVVGEKIYVDAALGQREMDIVVEVGGRYFGIEVKSGGAIYGEGPTGPKQEFNDLAISNNVGGIATGARARQANLSGVKIESVTTVYVP